MISRNFSSCPFPPLRQESLSREPGKWLHRFDGDEVVKFIFFGYAGCSVDGQHPGKKRDAILWCSFYRCSGWGSLRRFLAGRMAKGYPGEIHSKFHGVNLNPLLRRARPDGYRDSCILSRMPFMLPAFAIALFRAVMARRYDEAICPNLHQPFIKVFPFRIHGFN
jgi:hypothetical protein